MPKFGTENALFGFFWPRMLKNYCHIRNQHTQICHESLIFSLRQCILVWSFLFIKGLGFPFSKCPDPGPGPFFQVCSLKV